MKIGPYKHEERYKRWIEISRTDLENKLIIRESTSYGGSIKRSS